MRPEPAGVGDFERSRIHWKSSRQRANRLDVRILGALNGDTITGTLTLTIGVPSGVQGQGRIPIALR